jgi:uncharacterized membrane protein
LLVGVLGYVHVAFGVLALVTGLAIFRIAKGTQRHRVLGYGYVASMLGLNVTGLLIYQVFGTFGPFHVLAVISLATLVAGWYPAYVKRPAGQWLRWHYEGICWSYVGLLAATAAEIAVRLPFVRGFGLAFGLATFVSSFVVVFLGAYVLYRYRDEVLARFRPPDAGPHRPPTPIHAEPKALEGDTGG